jgi:PIN domain
MKAVKVVFDTTVLAQGFNPRSADVEMLRIFFDRTHGELCVPAVVLEEAVNLVGRAVEEANAKLAALRRLTGNDKDYVGLETSRAKTVYRGSLHQMLKAMGGRVLPYPKIDHDRLVQRALIPYKPFVTSGRGYRDSLVWFSLVELAQVCDEEVIFISGNTADWCQTKNESKLHTDFLKDLDRNGIRTSRIRLFKSLGDFIQEYAVTTLPFSLEADDYGMGPDYEQVLIDGKDWIETILSQALPDFLCRLSRAGADVKDVQLLDLSTPSGVQDSPPRAIDTDRKLLEFSARFRIAMQFLIRRPDLAVWSQRLALQQREDWDENYFRVIGTTGIRVKFRMIVRGENTEEFSIASVDPDYYEAYLGLDPVAVRLGQSEVRAPEHGTWGTVACDRCDAKFAVGCHSVFPAGTESECVAKLERILEEDHEKGRPHKRLYELPA